MASHQSHNMGEDFILDAALDAIVTIDAEGMITGWNAPAETIFGWSQQEAVGQRLSDTIIPQRRRAAHNQCLKDFVATGGHPLLPRWAANAVLHRTGYEFRDGQAIDRSFLWGVCARQWHNIGRSIFKGQ